MMYKQEVIILKYSDLESISIGYLNREGYSLYFDTPEKDYVTLIR